MAAGAARGLTGNSNFIRSLAQATEAEIARQAQHVADEAVRRADALVSKLYVTDRAGSRRRPGRHLLGSFRGEVELHRGARVPVRILLKSSAPGAKVNSLNSGSSPHLIDGHPFLSFPKTEGAFDTARSNARAGRFRGSRAGNQAVLGNAGSAAVVAHPGTLGTHFLEQALEQAVSAAYHQAVRIPRH